MDTLPDREFVKIFHRSAKYINFKGAVSPKVLEDRMKKLQRDMIKAKHLSKRKSTKRKLTWKMHLIGTLRKRGFHRRVHDEAIADPYSIYAYSLKYGYPKAVKKKLKEAEARIRRRLHRRRR